MQASDVLTTREYYSRIGVWPEQPFVIDPRGWLSNFSGKRDEEIAVALLESFMFFNEKQTLKMFETAFAALASEEYVRKLPGARLEEKWALFRATALVSFPTDDAETASSSGYMFVRLARQTLKLPDAQLLDPGQLVQFLANSLTPAPVVLTDDLVGSGDQFNRTWTRTVSLSGGGETSLQEEVRRLGCPVFYAPAICTEVGMSAIAALAPEVKVRPAHFLPKAYSAADSTTLLVPDSMRSELHEFVVRQSERLGVGRFGAFGWNELGLAIAFDHSTPDLTLPIFRSEFPGWRPLVRRR